MGLCAVAVKGEMDEQQNPAVIIHLHERSKRLACKVQTPNPNITGSWPEEG